ncbi:hypothetical protein NDU88_007237 [Pleurodeles waltl]|uniref:Uncharacterized protein n=1 Tax=Pleurodeles waltl TaxID=8319 RepID=A0AAV7RR59_PLEWA|nr:hypothetical protein NDU88_007237 [Pleurodeles waltl]
MHDNQEGLVIARLRNQSCTLTVLNTYAPNKDDPSIFQQLLLERSLWEAATQTLTSNEDQEGSFGQYSASRQADSVIKMDLTQ